MAIKANIGIFRDLIYPVGSIYISVNSTNPGTLFGGTWEQIKDCFLLGCGNTYSNGSTGGEATHKLTIDEMPSHNHSLNEAAQIPKSNPSLSGNEWNANFLIQGEPASWNRVYPITSDVGKNVAHNNMPPYIAVYIWKRTG